MEVSEEFRLIHWALQSTSVYTWIFAAPFVGKASSTPSEISVLRESSQERLLSAL